MKAPSIRPVASGNARFQTTGRIVDGDGRTFLSFSQTLDLPAETTLADAEDEILGSLYETHEMPDEHEFLGVVTVELD